MQLAQYTSDLDFIQSRIINHTVDEDEDLQQTYTTMKKDVQKKRAECYKVFCEKLKGENLDSMYAQMLEMRLDQEDRLREELRQENERIADEINERLFAERRKGWAEKTGKHVFMGPNVDS